jgi:hypothetical protein
MKIVGSLLRSVWAGLKGVGSLAVQSLDPLSKLAQVGALIIAGIWTYHLRQITGEEEINPEVWVSAQATAYDQTTRLLLVRVREKNVGKIPVILDPEALKLVVKKIPDGLSPGYIDMDKQPVLFDDALFKKYDDGVELSPGAEYEDVAQLVVAPGLYHIEATLSLPDDDMVDGVTVQRVE